MATTVSVILPAYNAERFIASAVASVDAQTWPDIHLIVVNDGSTDATGHRLREIAAGWDRPGRTISVHTVPNSGAGAARNSALAHATGEFVLFMDADDVLYPDLVRRLVAELTADPTADLAFPDHRYIDERGEPTGYRGAARASRFDPGDLVFENPIHSASGVLARREVVERAGRFDPEMRACIDLDLWVRIGNMRPGNIVALGEVMADYRKNEGQITGDWRRMRAGWRRVVEKLADAGHPLSPTEYRRARARSLLYWSSIAYDAGQYRDARRLIAQTWLAAPVFAAGSPLARVRLLACIASFLPADIHKALRARHKQRSRAQLRPSDEKRRS